MVMMMMIMCTSVCHCVLQDREQVLASIDALLLQQPITSQHLASFVVEHPDVVGQEGSKDHVPPVYSDSNSVSCDTVSVPADTVDTSSNTADTDSSISATPTRRDVLHKSVPHSFTYLITLHVENNNERHLFSLLWCE